VSSRLTAVYQIPCGQFDLPSGIGTAVRPKPHPRTAGPRQLVEGTRVSGFMNGPNGTGGTAPTALRPKEASG
jgi:hypothetical protein